jgi:hypothetical protein
MGCQAHGVLSARPYGVVRGDAREDIERARHRARDAARQPVDQRGARGCCQRRGSCKL